MPQVPGRTTRAALARIDAFTAITAVGGGLALAAGLEAGRFPDAWLAGAVLLGWILGEIVLLTGDGERISSLEVVYLAAGAAMVALGYRVAGGQAARDPE